jgi:hypothetical protein
MDFPVPTKKRKLDGGGGGEASVAWPSDRQVQVFSELKKVLEPKDAKLELAYAHRGHYHSVTATGYRRVSTDTLRAVCGECLGNINVRFAPQAATLELQITDEPDQLGRIPVQYVSRFKHKESAEESKLVDQDPDKTMLLALENYARDYLSQETPREVQTSVQDKTTATLFGVKPPKKEYEMRILGWQNATLQQLEEFRNMLPYHVTNVEIDNQRVFVTMNTYTQPLHRVFFVAT